MAYNWKNAALFGPLGGLFGRKKKNAFEMIEPRPYTGARPYSADDVGLGASTLKPLSEQYAKQISERSRGEGLVGFDPSRRETLRSEYLQDFGDYEKDIMDQASAKASGQGLRGGIPVSIGQQYAKSLSRARQSGLADIDIEDLEARREDINRATYAQPELVGQGAGIQQSRAAFDLGEYEATQPTYLEPQQSNVLPALIGAAGTIGGAYLGGPAGAGVGNTLAQALLSQQKNQSANRSINVNRFSEAQDPYSQFFASLRRR